MLRFDYVEQKNGQFQVTVVSERGDTHSMAGRLLLEKEEWEFLWKSIMLYDTPSSIQDPIFQKIERESKENFAKFENKGEPK